MRSLFSNGTVKHTTRSKQMLLLCVCNGLIRVPYCIRQVYTQNGKSPVLSELRCRRPAVIHIPCFLALPAKPPFIVVPYARKLTGRILTKRNARCVFFLTQLSWVPTINGSPLLPIFSGTWAVYFYRNGNYGSRQ